MSQQAEDADSDFLTFMDEDDDAVPENAAAAELDPWIVLVVDDDEGVHAISRAVLGEVRFQNRKMEILSCYSGREACALFDQRSDIAVTLLDVVMESDDAGLKVVRHIRDVAKNSKVRIVLRTGQPGQAPEESVIVNYDINDYKSKTDLTAQKLFTTLVTALRSFDGLLQIEESRTGLRRIGDASGELFALRDPDEFMSRTVAELTAFVGTEVGAVFAREGAQADLDSGWRPMAMRGWPIDHEEEVLAGVAACAAAQESRYDTQTSFLFVTTPDGRELIAYLAHQREISAVTRELLEFFVAKIGIGYDNVVMHRWREQTNIWLEDQVRERTHELSEKTTHLETVNRQMAEELKLASVLQQSILPVNFPTGLGVSVAARMLPAREVGGDFYNVMQLGSDKLGFVVADVSGKGVPAAFFMLRAHVLIQEIAAAGESPARCLALANDRLCQENPLNLFVTLFFGILDLSNRVMTYSTAGHDMPIWLGADGALKPIGRAGGMLLGMFGEATYQEDSVTLAEGDRMFLFTDGVTEAMAPDGTWFGLERLESAIRRTHGLDVGAGLDQVVRDTQAFCRDNPQSDDITCLFFEAGSAKSA